MASMLCWRTNPIPGQYWNSRQQEERPAAPLPSRMIAGLWLWPARMPAAGKVNSLGVLFERSTFACHTPEGNRPIESTIRGPGIQGFRLWGPNAWGSRSLSVVSIMPGPSQTQKTSASGPNSLRTCRQAPQGAVGAWVGV